jgi:(R,R)-butanediol dehydrogenase/meso-butanediol dehydrogenase/diacetyl reductase
MRALRYYGRGDVRLEDVAEPDVTPGRVKVDVQCCGICGSDLHFYLKGPMGLPTREQPHPLTGEFLPLTLGHECAGEVSEVGDGVSAVSVGDLVAVEPLLVCHECQYCLAGEYHRCLKMGAIGNTGNGGGFSKYVVIDEQFAHRLPTGVSVEAAAVAEPICVGWHGVARSGVGPDGTALVLGAGPVGLGALLSLKAAAVGFVAVAEAARGVRTELAEEFGADLVIDTSRQALADVINEATDGQGVDVAFDVAGAQATMDYAVAAVKMGGTVVDVAVYEDHPVLNTAMVMGKEITLLGSRAYTEYPQVLQAIADGRIPDPLRMVTSRVSLDQAVDKGIRALIENRANEVKVLVQP